MQLLPQWRSSGNKADSSAALRNDNKRTDNDNNKRMNDDKRCRDGSEGTRQAMAKTKEKTKAKYRDPSPSAPLRVRMTTSK
jgi:hypothetical protein